MNYPRAALTMVAALVLARIGFLLVSPLTLFIDEAQYWLWGKELAFGYYSKPPMIGWLIGLSTALCGDSPACVRLPAPILHGITALLIYALGARLFSARIGFWACLTYALLPGVALSSFLIATDAPLLLCWAGALYALIRAHENNHWGWWLLFALALGAGALSKYTMLMLLAGIFLLIWRHPAWRPLARNKRFHVALIIATMIFSPNLLWNMQHGWVSIKHTGDNARIGNWFSSVTMGEAPQQAAPLIFSHCAPFTPNIIPPTKLGERLEFFAAQFGVFGPILFTALLLFLWRERKCWQSDPKQALLVWTLLPLFLMVSTVSLLARAHANWGAPVYVGATLLVAGYLLQRHRSWLIAAIVLHGLIFVAFHHYDTLRSISENRMLAKWDPFARLRGFEPLVDSIHMLEQQYPHAAILSTDRKLTATLVYLLRDKDGRPGNVYKWNPEAAVRDYYDMTRDVKNTSTRDFILVSPALSYVACDIATYFDRAQEHGVIDMPSPKRKQISYAIDLLTGFQGYRP